MESFHDVLRTGWDGMGWATSARALVELSLMKILSGSMNLDSETAAGVGPAVCSGAAAGSPAATTIAVAIARHGLRRFRRRVAQRPIIVQQQQQQQRKLESGIASYRSTLTFQKDWLEHSLMAID